MYKRMRRENLFLSFIVALFAGIVMFFTACNSCSKDKAPADEQTTDTAVVSTDLVVENVISTNRQDMYMKYGGDYTWFETCIVLKDFIDAEESDGTVTGISNVFQVINNNNESYDVHVLLYSTTADTTAVDEKIGFWVEDLPLNEEEIKVTFADAYDRLMRANIVKPHSRQVVLRKQLGPVDTNPQYIFGNAQAQVYVDATTGDVSAKNPVFPNE